MKRVVSWVLASCAALMMPVHAAASAGPAIETAPAAAAADISAHPLMGAYYAVRISGVPDASDLEVRAWTDMHGKDDLMRYRAVCRDGVWCAAIGTSRHGGGAMTAEVYADGSPIGSVRFNAPEPSGPNVLLIPRMASYYTILVSNLDDASSVRVPVWSVSSDGHDVVWYDAQDEGDGIWSVQINTASHCGGDMRSTVYADGTPVAGTAFRAPRTAPSARTELVSGTRYKVVAENLWGVQQVQVAAWGTHGDQDDIIWYTAQNTSPGVWTASINAASHDEGTILNHVYADGTAVCDPVRVTRSFLSVSDESGQSTSAPALRDLSSKGSGWGFGGPKDASGRPEAATDAQARYGHYDADFIGPADSRIYLTFDEGYENGYTAKILDTLKEKNVQGVFFVTYPYVKEHPDLVRRMIDEGHVVGNHSATHPSFPTISAERAVDEVMRVHRLMQTEFGYDMTVFRFPSGEYSERDLALLQALGYRTAFWSYAYKDWEPSEQIGASAAFRKAANALHPGALYLLHAVSRDNAQMLGDLIDHCRAAGYTIAPYEEIS